MKKGHILVIHAGSTSASVATKSGLSPRLSCVDLLGRADRAPASVDPKVLIVLISGMSGQREEPMRVLSRWGNDQQASVIAKSHLPHRTAIQGQIRYQPLRRTRPRPGF